MEILAYTADMFGSVQAKKYNDLIFDTIAALAEGPDGIGSRPRDEIAPGLRTLHVSKSGRRGRHFVMYVTRLERTIEVLRLLHDAMDLARHLPPKT